MPFFGNLTGLELRVASSMEAGIAEIAILPDGSKVLDAGVSVLVLLDLQKILNFSIKPSIVDEFFPETTPEEGSPLTESTLAYQLATGNADIAIGLLYHVLYRIKFASPLMSFSNDLFYAYFQQPTNIMEQNNVFQKPFQPQLALSILLLLFTIGILAEFSTLSKISTANLFMKLVNALEWVAATVSQQDSTSIRNANIPSYLKLSLYSGTLLSLWLYSYYSAAILSYFATDRDMIQKFSQIGENGFTVYAIGSVNASIPFQSADGKGVPFNHINVEYNKSIDLVFEGNHAHMDTVDLFFIAAVRNGKTKEEACTISKVQVEGGIIRSGFYSRFGFPHKEVFGVGILKIRQSGLFRKYFTNYLDSVTIVCPRAKRQYHEDLGLTELWHLYSTYFWSVIASLVILAMEIVFPRYFCRARTNLKKLLIK